MEIKTEIVEYAPGLMLSAICHAGFAPENIPEDRLLANEILAICRERGFTTVQMKRGAVNYLSDLMGDAVPTLAGYLAFCERERDWEREQAKALRDQAYPDDDMPDRPTTGTHPWNEDPEGRANRIKGMVRVNGVQP